MRKKNQKKCSLCEKLLSNELQKKLIRLRERAHDLFYSTGWNKLNISKRLKVSRNFVQKWTQTKKMDFTLDGRGWTKGKGRRWKKEVLVRLENLHRSLSKKEENFFYGATVLQQEWLNRYRTMPPPLRTLGRLMKQLGLSQGRKKKMGKGASRYLCYPEHSIHHSAGQRVLEIDFIGKKFIRGRTAPIHFAAASFKYPPKLRYYERVKSESADELMRFLQNIFERFEKPDVVKMDNGFAMSGTAPHPRVVSQLPLWLLQQKIVSMYAVPRKPFSQASIEGNNSVFGRKFWNRFEFKNTAEIDKKLVLFNQSSLRYYQYQPFNNSSGKNKKFVPEIFYLRQVRGDENEKAFIEVANEKIRLPKTYLNYFLMAQWNLRTEQLTVFIEKEKQLKKIKSVTFTLNPKSKQKLFF